MKFCIIWGEREHLTIFLFSNLIKCNNYIVTYKKGGYTYAEKMVNIYARKSVMERAIVINLIMAFTTS